MVLRTVVAAGLAGLVCGTATWMLSSNYLSGWWLVPLVLLPSAAAVLVLRRNRRGPWLIMDGLWIVAACVVAAVLAWSPEPAVFGAVRAHQASATSAAEALIASQTPGTCLPPDATTLGVLADFGPWDEVCVYGTADRSSGGVQLRRPAGSSAPGLVYSSSSGSPTGVPTVSSGCVRRIEGKWWADQPPSATDWIHPCPRQFTFLPGG